MGPEPEVKATPDPPGKTPMTPEIIECQSKGAEKRQITALILIIGLKITGDQWWTQHEPHP